MAELGFKSTLDNSITIIIMHGGSERGKITIASVFVSSIISHILTTFAMRNYAAISLFSCIIAIVSSTKTMALATVNDGLSTVAEHPYFDDISPRNVTTVVDETVTLKCRVKNKGNRTVSWMRKRDLHILTSNIYTYTGDQRFSVMHGTDTDDWDLKIEYAQQRDSGIYECQINTEPKINMALHLEVTGTARARIAGSHEVHVKKGSTISLSCNVNVHASSVSWFHGSSIVDFDSARGGISLETEKTDGGTSSRLMLTRAALRDSGNYTCLPAGAVPASVHVHVLSNGEHPAAMQTSSSGPCPSHTAVIFLSIVSLYYTSCQQISISQLLQCCVLSILCS